MLRKNKKEDLPNPSERAQAHFFFSVWEQGGLPCCGESTPIASEAARLKALRHTDLSRDSATAISGRSSICKGADSAGRIPSLQGSEANRTGAMVSLEREAEGVRIWRPVLRLRRLLVCGESVATSGVRATTEQRLSRPVTNLR